MEVQNKLGSSRDPEAEVFQVSNDDTVVAQRRCRAVILKTRVPGQEGVKDNATERYREDSNEDAFRVAVVEKIYAHESLTFNDTVFLKNSDDSHDYYWKYAPEKGNILGLEIIRDQSGDTLRVS
ncbi:hypothetical protein Tco_1183019 [Tanacetum coccineum]